MKALAMDKDTPRAAKPRSSASASCAPMPRRSSTTTCAPPSLSSIASRSPTGPAPTTMTSMPVAEAVLANTLSQAALARPGAQATAMRDLFSKLLELDEVNAYIDGLTSGLAARYDLGVEREDVGHLIGDRPAGRAGSRTSLFAQMAEGDGVLLDASPDGSASRLANGFARLKSLPAESGSSMLIRPDGCVAWAGEGGEVDGLTNALERWFAPAAPCGEDRWRPEHESNVRPAP